jgi:hypothetical protein
MPPVRHGAVLSISIDQKLAEAIRAQAAKERRTISAIVSMSLEYYLESVADAPKPRARLVRPA